MRLCGRLLDQRQKVFCADSLFTGTKRNVNHLREHPRIEFLQHDMTFPLCLWVDEIYNLACPAPPICDWRDTVQTANASAHDVKNMLGLAKRLRIGILQALTREV